MKNSDKENLLDSTDWRLVGKRSRRWFGSFVGSISCLLVLCMFVVNDKKMLIYIYYLLPIAIIIIILMLVSAAFVGVALTNFFNGRLINSAASTILVVAGACFLVWRVLFGS